MSRGCRPIRWIIAFAVLVAVISSAAVAASLIQRPSSGALDRMDSVLEAPVEKQAPHKTEGTMTAEEREKLMRRLERDIAESEERAKKGPPDLGCAAECKRKAAGAPK